MKRRHFLELFGGATGMAAGSAMLFLPGNSRAAAAKRSTEINADVVIAGGGLGGCAAALAALRNGLSVVLTEETDWLGGQLTQQGVPPDEHQWIETHGCTRLYRDFRTGIRNYYIRNYPLTAEASSRQFLNPGDGFVSRLCHEPRVALAVLYELFNPYLSSGKLTLLLEHKAVKAAVNGDKIKALTFKNNNDQLITLVAPYFIDATELGDLLPLTGTEYNKGAESKADTQELHAPEIGNPENHQAFTVCFAIDHVKGANLVIDKPQEYNFWRNYIPQMTPPWPGKLLSMTYSTPATLVPKTLGFHPEGISTGNQLNMWNYRRLIAAQNFKPNTYQSDITLVNWPQNDYLLGNLFDVNEKTAQKHVARAKQLSLSLFYWLQTEIPRADGGQGWPGLRLRGDVLGTTDGMAKYPYIRESRRIKALFTIKEEHVGAEQRALITDNAEHRAANFYDSVGVGSYQIDLHPSTGGRNYIDFPSLPFQIPLGALIPQRMENLLAANKNIGTTHITNGCYRLHPVEWNIGESAGMLISYALTKKARPHTIRENKSLLTEFQDYIRKQGIETHWPNN